MARNIARMRTPEFGLSLAFLDADPRSVNWSDLREMEHGEGIQLQLPTPTYGDWQENDSDVPANIAKRKPHAVMNSADVERFEETDAHYQWRDGFEPMMNYAWPVSLAYGLELADAANAINAYGPACTLVELSDEAKESLYGNDSDSPDYVIALSGGGMNLSDHIAAAYLACGCVPPNRILSGLHGVIDDAKAKRLPLRAAYKAAADHYRDRAKRMRDECTRVHAASHVRR